MRVRCLLTQCKAQELNPGIEYIYLLNDLNTKLSSHANWEFPKEGCKMAYRAGQASRVAMPGRKHY